MQILMIYELWLLTHAWMHARMHTHAHAYTHTNNNNDNNNNKILAILRSHFSAIMSIDTKI